MCFMITLLVAVVSTVVWYGNASKNNYQLGTLCLMYWGATLMWFVDGIFVVAEGEPFLDISFNDALLGFVVVTCGLVAWLVVLLYKDPKNVMKSLIQKN